MNLTTPLASEAGRQTEILSSTNPERAILASQLICDRLIAYDNVSVYALVGNAADPDLQENIRDAKGIAPGIAP